MTDTTNHADVIRKALRSYSNWGGRLVAAEGLAALDALTREVEEAKAEAQGFHTQIMALNRGNTAQAERIKALEEALRGASVCLEELVPSTTSGFKPNRLAKRGLELLSAALAPKEAQP